MRWLRYKTEITEWFEMREIVLAIFCFFLWKSALIRNVSTWWELFDLLRYMFSVFWKRRLTDVYVVELDRWLSVFFLQSQEYLSETRLALQPTFFSPRIFLYAFDETSYCRSIVSFYDFDFECFSQFSSYIFVPPEERRKEF